MKVVFATETLSLGINMPAKTVVIEDLWKFQGERHELLTPGEYTQLTGRAGRRGIDPLGHAVVVYQRQVPFERVAGLAATRTYDLGSSFRPSYNMAVNLVRNYDPEQAHHLLNSSFAQFLTDRGVVALERRREGTGRRSRGTGATSCATWGTSRSTGSCANGPRRMREEDRRGPGSRPRAGDQGGAGRAAARRRRPRQRWPGAGDSRWCWARPATADRRRSPRTGGTSGSAPRDFDDPPVGADADPAPAVGERPERALPARRRGTPRGPAGEAAQVAEAAGGRSQGGEGGRHARGRGGGPPVPRVSRTRQTRTLGGAGLEAARRRWRASSGGSRRGPRPWLVSSTASSGCSTTSGTCATGSLTDKGRRLTRIYGEGDLLVGEAIDAGLLEALTPAEVAALVSTVVYEARERHPLTGRDADRRHGRRLRAAAAALAAGPAGRGRAPGAALSRARARVRGARLPLGRGQAARRRAGRDRDGARATSSATASSCSTCCGRSSEVAPPATAAAVRGAIDAVARGVVAYTGVSLR